MRIVRALATFAARNQPHGTRRLLSVRFASDFVSRSARPGAVADAEVLADLKNPVIIDVRDPEEVEAGKGGPPAAIPGAVNVPLNMDGVKQSERPTTQDEFLDNIKNLEQAKAEIGYLLGRAKILAMRLRFGKWDFDLDKIFCGTQVRQSATYT